MIKIRENVFETNSSSTHAICIPNKPQTFFKGTCLYFNIKEYGWEVDRWVDPCSYLYTAILSAYYKEQADERVETLKKILDKYEIHYAFEDPKWRKAYNSHDYYLDSDGYVDHADELIPLLDTLFNDEDLLMSYLFGAEICTGNDNSGWEDVENFWDEHDEGEFFKYWKGN